MGGYDVMPPEHELIPGESERSREVYRYFTPPRTAEPGSTNFALFSDYPMLTTTVRFTALQLRKSRVVVSLVENGVQWIIAECIQRTKPLFGVTDDYLDAFLYSHPDDLQNGQSFLCRATVKMQPPRIIRKATPKSPDGPSQPILPFSANDPPIKEIPDLSQHSFFQHLQCVRLAPYYRSYIGVPLRTRKGYYIGSLCILDPMPARLSPRGRLFVREMAHNIMHYLDLMLLAKSANSFKQMQNSLFQFMDPSTLTMNVPQVPGPMAAQPFSQEPLVILLPESPADLRRKGLIPPDGTVPSSSSSSNTSGPSSEGSTSSHASSSSGGAPTPATGVRSSNVNPHIAAPPTNATNEDVFTRACRLVRDAIGADGALITDAGPKSRSDPEATQWAFPGTMATKLQASVSHIVAIRGIDVAPRAMHEFGLGLLDSRFLEQVADKHPKGKIFCYGNFSEVTVLDLGYANMRRRSLYVRQHMRYFLPESKSCICVPLSEIGGGPFGTLIVWTYNPKKVFVREQIYFLKTFTQIMMFEVARQNAVSAEREKESFMSSISHELRSPLYGIMGATDSLRRTLLDDNQRESLDLVTVSGNALQDTLNHVLDFSKLARFMKDGAGTDMFGVAKFEDVDLPSCTEEIVRGVFTAYDFLRTNLNLIRRTSTSSIVPLQPDTTTVQKDDKPVEIPKSNVEVIIDIQRSDNWLLRTDIGAYRRVLTNLLGNALKYTDSGHVRVLLTIEPYVDRKVDPALRWKVNKSKITLTISDTGRGISPEFLPKLFVPFSQENRLSAGTGLGMSIVKQIIDILGWDINVRSQLGSGTDMILSLVLDHGSEQRQPPPQNPASLAKPKDPVSMSWVSQIRNLTQGKRVAFVDFNDSEELALNYIKDSIVGYSSEWYNMEVVEIDGVSSLTELSGKVDILVLNEDSQFVTETQERVVKPAVIVVCSRAARVQFSRTSPKEENIVEYMWKPCGPKAYAQALRRCLVPSERGRSYMDVFTLPNGKKMQRRLSAFSRETFGPESESAAESPASATEDHLPTNAAGPSSGTRTVASKSSSASSSLDKGKSPMPFGDFPAKLSQVQTATRSSMDAMMLSIQGMPKVLDLVDDDDDDDDALGERVSEDQPSYSLPLLERENPLWLSILENVQNITIQADAINHTPAPIDIVPPPPMGDMGDVLVVDDNVLTKTITGRMLHRLGFSVVEVEDGQRAVDVYRGHQGGFEAVFMDIQLPGLNGLDATRAIREIERERGCEGLTFIIALTGGNNAEDALAAGCNRFCTKPLQLDNFDAALEEHQLQYAIQSSTRQ
ncbi:hypothetical protein TWF696_005160 [Orbilia brochopaga]|uniref:Uncharacterized protein n=1 Tax=Orbilia brochopaga TaxID=3140254 RepID=A0AAV9V357_9PEZI